MLQFEGPVKMTNSPKYRRIEAEVNGQSATAMWPAKMDEEFAINDEAVVLVIDKADLPRVLEVL